MQGASSASAAGGPGAGGAGGGTGTTRGGTGTQQGTAATRRGKHSHRGEDSHTIHIHHCDFKTTKNPRIKGVPTGAAPATTPILASLAIAKHFLPIAQNRRPFAPRGRCTWSVGWSGSGRSRPSKRPRRSRPRNGYARHKVGPTHPLSHPTKSTPEGACIEALVFLHQSPLWKRIGDICFRRRDSAGSPRSHACVLCSFCIRSKLIGAIELNQSPCGV